MFTYYKTFILYKFYITTYISNIENDILGFLGILDIISSHFKCTLLYSLCPLGRVLTSTQGIVEMPEVISVGQEYP